jgi:tRNA G18 (ribose-2'-O)-methylase SpoU
MANIIKVDDLGMPELDVFVRLTGAQLRSRLEPEKAIFIAESPTVIEVALNSGCIPVSILTDERLLHGAVKGIIERCDEKFPGIPVYTADRDTLRDITGFELTRGALCAMKRPALYSPEQICKNAKRIAVLEGIADSTNIGAIFRSAAALGIDAVLLTPTSCDPLSRRALRVSMGTVMQVPWTFIGKSHTDWPEKGMEILHALGFKTAAMALTDDSVSIEDEALLREEKLAIILGTEGDGLAKATIASCDYTVKIPMSHGVDSLNVAAASAVAFWQLRSK